MTQPASIPPAAALPAGDSPGLVSENAPTFDVLPLSRDLRETLAEIGYTHPTPVQIAVWEPATRGRDAVVQARTGTGKTAAFALPIVDHIVKRSLAQVQVLVLCPTRELALQVSREIERLGAKKGVKVAAVYGGAAMQRQIDQIEAGAQVIVGTPGRVLDHLRRGTLQGKHVRLVVLDESDEMLSMGFERELTAILETVPPERQTLLFSATLPPDIERIAKNKLRTPDLLTLSGDHVGALSIKHFVYMVAGDKLAALVRVLEVEDPEGAVIFCNTKDETETVASGLRKRGFDADWLNGDLPQNDREKVMSATREGRLRYLVATDVAARGIDISHLTHVINHDFPQDAEAYVHRTGRTGRAGKTGTAISLVTPRDIGQLYLLRLTYKIRPIEKQIPTEGELKTRAEADLVNMLAEAFVERGTHPDDLALARRLLTHDQADVMLAGLLRDHLGARPDAAEDAAAARRAPRPIPERTRRERDRDREALRSAPPPVMPGTPPIATHAARISAPIPTAPTPPSSTQVSEAVSSEPALTLPGGAAPRVPLARPDAEPSDRRPPRDRGPRRAPRDDRDKRRPGDARRERDPSLDMRERAADPRDERGERGAGPDTAPSEGRGTRTADLVSWQPPIEEGDDDPILAGAAHEAPRLASPAAPRQGRMRTHATPPANDDAGATRPRPQTPSDDGGFAREARSRPQAAAAAAPHELELEGDWVELYVNVGRRENARALDFLRLLVDSGALDKNDVRRVRVRDRNAFVSVPRAAVERALSALNGAVIGQRTLFAEVARGGGGGGEDRGPRPEGPAAPAPDSGAATPDKTSSE